LAGPRAALDAGMAQIGAAPDDPRMAPLMAQMQALMQQHVAAASLAREGSAAGNVAMLHAPTHAATRDDKGGQAAAAALTALPPKLKDLVEGYVQTVRADRDPAARVLGAGVLGAGVLGVGAFFKQAPALADSDAGRALLQLPPADKA